MSKLELNDVIKNAEKQKEINNSLTSLKDFFIENKSTSLYSILSPQEESSKKLLVIAKKLPIELKDAFITFSKRGSTDNEETRGGGTKTNSDKINIQNKEINKLRLDLKTATKPEDQESLRKQIKEKTEAINKLKRDLIRENLIAYIQELDIIEIGMSISFILRLDELLIPVQFSKPTESTSFTLEELKTVKTRWKAFEGDIFFPLDSLAHKLSLPIEEAKTNLNSAKEKSKALIESNASTKKIKFHEAYLNDYWKIEKKHLELPWDTFVSPKIEKILINPNFDQDPPEQPTPSNTKPKVGNTSTKPIIETTDATTNTELLNDAPQSVTVRPNSSDNTNYITELTQLKQELEDIKQYSEALEVSRDELFEHNKRLAKLQKAAAEKKHTETDSFIKITEQNANLNKQLQSYQEIIAERNKKIEDLTSEIREFTEKEKKEIRSDNIREKQLQDLHNEIRVLKRKFIEVQTKYEQQTKETLDYKELFELSQARYEEQLTESFIQSIEEGTRNAAEIYRREQLLEEADKLTNPERFTTTETDISSLSDDESSKAGEISDPELLETLTIIARLKNEQSDLTAQLEDALDVNTGWHQVIEEKDEAIEQLQKQKAELEQRPTQDELDQLNGQLELAKEKADELQRKVDTIPDLQEDLRQARLDAETAKNKADALQQQVNTISDLQEDLLQARLVAETTKNKADVLQQQVDTIPNLEEALQLATAKIEKLAKENEALKLIQGYHNGKQDMDEMDESEDSGLGIMHSSSTANQDEQEKVSANPSSSQPPSPDIISSAHRDERKEDERPEKGINGMKGQAPATMPKRELSHEDSQFFTDLESLHRTQKLDAKLPLDSSTSVSRTSSSLSGFSENGLETKSSSNGDSSQSHERDSELDSNSNNNKRTAMPPMERCENLILGIIDAKIAERQTSDLHSSIQQNLVGFKEAILKAVLNEITPPPLLEIEERTKTKLEQFIDDRPTLTTDSDSDVQQALENKFKTIIDDVIEYQISRLTQLEGGSSVATLNYHTANMLHFDDAWDDNDDWAPRIHLKADSPRVNREDLDSQVSDTEKETEVVTHTPIPLTKSRSTGDLSKRLTKAEKSYTRTSSVSTSSGRGGSSPSLSGNEDNENGLSRVNSHESGFNSDPTHTSAGANPNSNPLSDPSQQTSPKTPHPTPAQRRNRSPNQKELCKTSLKQIVCDKIQLLDISGYPPLIVADCNNLNVDDIVETILEKIDRPIDSRMEEGNLSPLDRFIRDNQQSFLRNSDNLSDDLAAKFESEISNSIQLATFENQKNKKAKITEIIDSIEESVINRLHSTAREACQQKLSTANSSIVLNSANQAALKQKTNTACLAGLTANVSSVSDHLKSLALTDLNSVNVEHPIQWLLDQPDSKPLSTLAKEIGKIFAKKIIISENIIFGLFQEAIQRKITSDPAFKKQVDDLGLEHDEEYCVGETIANSPHLISTLTTNVLRHLDGYARQEDVNEEAIKSSLTKQFGSQIDTSIRNTLTRLQTEDKKRKKLQAILDTITLEKVTKTLSDRAHTGLTQQLEDKGYLVERATLTQLTHDINAVTRRKFVAAKTQLRSHLEENARLIESLNQNDEQTILQTLIDTEFASGEEQTTLQGEVDNIVANSCDEFFRHYENKTAAGVEQACTDTFNYVEHFFLYLAIAKETLTSDALLNDWIPEQQAKLEAITENRLNNEIHALQQKLDERPNHLSKEEKACYENAIKYINQTKEQLYQTDKIDEYLQDLEETKQGLQSSIDENKADETLVLDSELRYHAVIGSQDAQALETERHTANTILSKTKETQIASYSDAKLYKNVEFKDGQTLMLAKNINDHILALKICREGNKDKFYFDSVDGDTTFKYGFFKLLVKSDIQHHSKNPEDVSYVVQAILEHAQDRQRKEKAAQQNARGHIKLNTSQKKWMTLYAELLFQRRAYPEQTFPRIQLVGNGLSMLSDEKKLKEFKKFTNEYVEKKMLEKSKNDPIQAHNIQVGHNRKVPQVSAGDPENSAQEVAANSPIGLRPLGTF